MSNYLHEIPVTAIIENEGQFLFSKRSRFEDKMAGKWVFPGGKVEKGEDVIQALYRELFEETGLEISNYVVFLSSYQFYDETSSSEGLVFYVKSTNRDIRKDLSIEEYKWINPEDIMDFDFSYKKITNFDLEKLVTIPGMEVHVRNALITSKGWILSNRYLLSVTEYQKNKCTMNKDYFLSIKNSKNIEEFLSKNSLLPHCT